MDGHQKHQKLKESPIEGIRSNTKIPINGGKIISPMPHGDEPSGFVTATSEPSVIDSTKSKYSISSTVQLSLCPREGKALKKEK